MNQQNSAQVFTQNWNVYEKIMHLNYMHHAEFTRKLNEIFKKNCDKKSKVLDIGCGDAASISAVLTYANISFYKAYDLSPAALQLASDNLSRLNFSYELKEGNMFDLIQKEELDFDLIYSSYAIHHLQDKEKQEMFKLCFEHLTSDGVLIYTDVFRRKKYNRQEYLEEYISLIKNKWQLISDQEKQLIIDHVTVYDFPSDFDETLNWLRAADFTVTSTFHPDNFHAMIIAGKV